MLQQCYINAVDRKTFVVLGLTLAPLTLYHCRVLQCIESPFEGGGGVANEETLFATAFICSLNGKEQIDEFLSGGYDEAIKELILERTKVYNTQVEFDKASEYFDYYKQRPMRAEQPGNSSPTAPWWGMYKSFLTDYCGYSNDEAWNCIVCEAFCETAYVGGRKEDKTLLSDNTIKLQEDIKTGKVKVKSQEELQAEMGHFPKCQQPLL